MERGRSLDGRECSWSRHILSDIMLLKNKPGLELEPRISPASAGNPSSLVNFSRGERGAFRITCSHHLRRRCSAVVFAMHGTNGRHGLYEIDRILPFPEWLDFVLDPKFRGDVGVAVPLTSGWWLIDARKFETYLKEDQPCSPKVRLELESLLRNRHPDRAPDAFWEWGKGTQKKLTALVDGLEQEFHLRREEAIQSANSNPAGALWALLRATMNASPSPQEISQLQYGGQILGNLDGLIARKWPELLTVFQGLTPAQIEYLLTNRHPQAERVAEWLQKHKSGSASAAAQFIGDLLSLRELARSVPKHIQADLKIDLPKLVEKIEFAPVLPPAAQESLKKEIQSVKALLNAEYGQADTHKIDRPVIHLHEVKLHMLQWTHVLKDRCLSQRHYSSAPGALSKRLEEAERALAEQIHLLKTQPVPQPQEVTRIAGELGGTLDLESLRSSLRDAIQSSSAVCVSARKAGADPEILEKKMVELEQLSGSIAARCMERKFREIILHGIALWRKKAAGFSRENTARVEAILQGLNEHLSTAAYVQLVEAAEKVCRRLAFLQAEESRSAEAWGLLLRNCSPELLSWLEITDYDCPVDHAAAKALGNGRKCETEIAARVSTVRREALGLLRLARQIQYCVPQTTALAEGNPISSSPAPMAGKLEAELQTEAFRKLRALAGQDWDRIERESQLARTIQVIEACILDRLEAVEGESLDALKQYIQSAIAAKSWPKIVSILALRQQRAIFGGGPPLSWLLWLRLQGDEDRDLELWRTVEQATRQAAWYAQEESTHDEARRRLEALESIQSPHNLLICETARRLEIFCCRIRKEIGREELHSLVLDLIERAAVAEMRLDQAQLAIFGQLLLSFGFSMWGSGGPPIHGTGFQISQEVGGRMARILQETNLWPGGQCD